MIGWVIFDRKNDEYWRGSGHSFSDDISASKVFKREGDAKYRSDIIQWECNCGFTNSKKERSLTYLKVQTRLEIIDDGKS